MELLKKEYCWNKLLFILIFFLTISACQNKVSEYKEIDNDRLIKEDTIKIERIKIKTH